MYWGRRFSEGSCLMYLKICGNMFFWSYIWCNFGEDFLIRETGVTWTKFELGGVHWSFLASSASVSGSAFYKLCFKKPKSNCINKTPFNSGIESYLVFHLKNHSCLDYFAEPLLIVTPIFIVTGFFSLLPAYWKTVVSLLKVFGFMFFHICFVFTNWIVL